MQWFETSASGRRSMGPVRPEVLSSLSMRCTAGWGLTDVWTAVTGTSDVQRVYIATLNAAVPAGVPVWLIYLTSTWTRYPRPARQISRPTWNSLITALKVSVAVICMAVYDITIGSITEAVIRISYRIHLFHSINKCKKSQISTETWNHQQ